MKQLFLALSLVAVLGCATTERAAYVGIGATTTAVEIARQAYVDHENTCSCVTQSEHDKVQSYYVKYQLAFKAAQDAITAYKTATVPNQSGLDMAVKVSTATASDVIALIESLLPASSVVKLKAELPKGAVKN